MIQIIHRRHNDLVTLENVFTLLIRVCRTHKNALEQYDIIILLASYLLFFRLKKQSNSFVYLQRFTISRVTCVVMFELTWSSAVEKREIPMSLAANFMY